MNDLIPQETVWGCAIVIIVVIAGLVSIGIKIGMSL